MKNTKTTVLQYSLWLSSIIQILKLSPRAMLKNTKTTVLQYNLWLISVIQILKLSVRAIMKTTNTTVLQYMWPVAKLYDSNTKADCKGHNEEYKDHCLAVQYVAELCDSNT